MGKNLSILTPALTGLTALIFTAATTIACGSGGGGAPTPTSVTLNPTTLSLYVGESGKLVATVKPDNASQIVDWESSNNAIATVGSDGTVRGEAAGEATIAVSTKDGGKTATCAATVVHDTRPINVYVGGSAYDVYLSRATVWKNGKATSMVPAIFTRQSCVTGLYVKPDGSMHAIGWRNDNGEYNDQRHPYYWVNDNTTQTKLPIPEGSPYFIDISKFSAHGNVLYAAASYSTGSASGYKANIWRMEGSNHVRTELGGPGTWTNAYGIAATGENSFVAVGRSTSLGSDYANGAIWRNSATPTMFPDDTHFRTAFIDGTDEYLGGFDFNGTTLAACYWKNATANNNAENRTWCEEPPNSYQSWVRSIFVDDAGVVHAAGCAWIVRYDDWRDDWDVVACYWRNGVLTQLSTAYSRADDIYVYEGVVYIAGFDGTTEPTKAALWTDGALTYLSNGNGLGDLRGDWASTVFVTRN
jgi:hypothetical protein